MWCNELRKRLREPKSVVAAGRLLHDFITRQAKKERIAFKYAVLVYKCLYGSAYLIDELCQVADVEAHQRLRSSSSSSLIVTRLSTVGGRAFPVAAAQSRVFC